MLDVFNVETVADLYSSVGEKLLNAKKVYPRGHETKELIAPKIVIQNPQSRLAYHKDRKYNLMFALVESLMLHSNKNDLKYFREFNENMKIFSDDGKTLNGVYGARIANFLPSIVEKLKSDDNSRQAVLSIYGNRDLVRNTKDKPCTLNLQFMVRDNKLIMITNMRSNDLMYGFQYDVFMFTMLQETIANELGIEVGPYIHEPASLHVYKEYYSFEGYEMLENIKDELTPIEFRNNGNLRDWKLLADSYTEQNVGMNPKIRGRSTPKDIHDLISIERLYKQLKDSNAEYKLPPLDTIPEWAKPFTKRWELK